MKIVMISPQGAGKGTYGSRLSSILKIPHIVTGDIFRENIKRGTPLGKKVEKFLNTGLLVPDEIVIEVVKKRLNQQDCKNGYILDGFPRTLKQAEELDEIAPPDFVIYLETPRWILIKRLSSRVVCKNCGKIYNLLFLKPKKEGVCDDCGGELIQRKDDTPEAIKMRLEEYNKKTKPIIDYYKSKGILKIFSNDKIDLDPDIAVKRILRILGVKK